MINYIEHLLYIVLILQKDVEHNIMAINHVNIVCGCLSLLILFIQLLLLYYMMARMQTKETYRIQLEDSNDATKTNMHNLIKHKCVHQQKYINSELQQLLSLWYQTIAEPHTERRMNNSIGAPPYEVPSLRIMQQLALSVDSINVYDRKKLSTNKNVFIDTSLYQYKFIVELNSLSFSIIETLNNTLTKGGSTFHIIVIGHTIRSICEYWDYFNGSYSVCCPAVSATSNIVNVTLMNVDYHSYKLHRSLYKQIGFLSFTASTSQLIRNTPYISNGNSLGVQLYNVVYSKNFYLTPPHGGVTVNVTPITQSSNGNAVNMKNMISECFRHKYSKVYFVGDSHIRYVFMYSKALLGKMLPGQTGRTLIESDQYENVYYRIVTYSTTLATSLKQVSKEVNQIDYILIVISVGAWDTHYKTPTSFILGISSGLDEIEHIKTKCRVEVIWQDIPPVPKTVGHKVGAYGMVKLSTTFMNAAINGWFNNELVQRGISVVHVFEIARPFKDNDVCGGHYLCVEHGIESIKGDSGLESAHQIFSKACL